MEHEVLSFWESNAIFHQSVKAHEGGQFEPKMRPDGAHINLREAPEIVDFIDEAIRGSMAWAS